MLVTRSPTIPSLCDALLKIYRALWRAYCAPTSSRYRLSSRGFFLNEPCRHAAKRGEEDEGRHARVGKKRGEWTFCSRVASLRNFATYVHAAWWFEQPPRDILFILSGNSLCSSIFFPFSSSSSSTVFTLSSKRASTRIRFLCRASPRGAEKSCLLV